VPGKGIPARKTVRLSNTMLVREIEKMRCGVFLALGDVQRRIVIEK